MEFIIGILFLLLIDVVLSVDNAILIASTTRDLDDDVKRSAQVLGAIGAVVLRLVFVVILMLLEELLSGVVLAYMVGGLILVYIAWTITDHSEDEKHSAKASTLWKAVLLIIAGDVMMSFDNAIIISEVTNRITDVLWVEITIVAIALFISLLIIIFFAKQLATFMGKNPWLIYVAAWLLLSVGIEMILKDPLFHVEISHIANFFIAYSIGGAIVLCKYLFIDLKHNEKNEDETHIE